MKYLRLTAAVAGLTSMTGLTMIGLLSMGLSYGFATMLTLGAMGAVLQKLDT